MVAAALSRVVRPVDEFLALFHEIGKNARQFGHLAKGGQMSSSRLLTVAVFRSLKNTAVDLRDCPSATDATTVVDDLVLAIAVRIEKAPDMAERIPLGRMLRVERDIVVAGDVDPMGVLERHWKVHEVV